MSGFTKIKQDTVEIKHFSTASVIKITVTHQKTDWQGEVKEVINEQWFNYPQFSDLKKAVNLTDDWL